MTGQVHIGPAQTAADIAAVATLFAAYAASLDFDLGYQDFATELATLPGKYAPPSGALLVARHDGAPVGCVALRPLEPGICEMKRLFVTPAGRGLGVGRALIAAVLAEAARIGHREMRLDTFPSMEGALALYLQAGFQTVAPYYPSPMPNTVFLARSLIADGHCPNSADGVD